MSSSPPKFVPLDWDSDSAESGPENLRQFQQTMARRRSVRDFSPKPVPAELIERAIAIAGAAPSGAHRQPWRFIVVSDPALKKEIRIAAEAEEKENYERRFSPEWLDALTPFGTDWHKEFLEVAPYLIVVFRLDYGVDAEQNKIKHYYVSESVGIATGFLLAALHVAGLATLTHTPSPMGFLTRICRRPPNERPFLLIPVGYPAEGAQVPNITRKPVSEIRILLEK